MRCIGREDLCRHRHRTSGRPGSAQRVRGQDSDGRPPSAARQERRFVSSRSLGCVDEMNAVDIDDLGIGEAERPEGLADRIAAAASSMGGPRRPARRDRGCAHTTCPRQDRSPRAEDRTAVVEKGGRGDAIQRRRRHSPRQSRYMTANGRGRRVSTSTTLPCCLAFRAYGRQTVCDISTSASGVMICATVPRWI